MYQWGKKRLPAISVNKGLETIKPSRLSPPTLSPMETRNRNRVPASSSHLLQLLTTVYAEMRMRKHKRLAPDTWGAYQIKDFNEPKLLYLPIYRKALNSLTWDIWFSLIYSNLMTLHYLPSVAKLLYSLAAPLASLEQLSQVFLRCSLPALKS